MTSVQTMRGYAALFNASPQSVGTGGPTQLQRLAEKSERNDIIQAAHKQRADALDEIGQVSKTLDHLDGTFEKVMGADSPQKKKYDFWSEVDRAGTSLKNAMEKWQKGTETLIRMDVLQATSVELAKETIDIANKVNLQFDQAQGLAQRGIERTDKNSGMGKVVRAVAQNLSDNRAATGFGVDNFIRTVLKRDPAEVRAGRFSIYA